MERVMEPLLARAAGGGGAAAAAAAVLLAVLALLWLASMLLKQRRGRLPPGPPGLPVLGNLLHLLGGTLPHRAMAALSKQYGPIVFLKLGSAPSLLISDASLAKECLSSPNDKIFASRPPMEVMRRITFGSSIGIATAPYGEDWRYARKLCSLQLFTNRCVSEFEPFRRIEIISLVDKMMQQIQNCKAGPAAGEPVDLSHLLSSLIEAITCRMLLGRPSSEIQNAKLGISMHQLVRRMGEIFQLPVIGDFIPALGFLDGKAKASLDEVRTSFGILIDNLIHERQQRPPGSPTVVLDVLLENLDLDRAKSVILELIVGSIDTSTTVLDWAMAELLANPPAMRKLQEELDTAAKLGPGGIIEEADMGGLVYMKAVMKETMRLHAPVPLLVPHMSTEQCTVGGYTIPQGTRLFVNAWAIGRDPKTWEDPERFWPDRFLSDDEGSMMDVRGQHFELLPFGSGRRSCPGMPLVLPLIESIFVNLVHNFEWQVPPSLPVDFSERFGAIVCRASPLYAIPHLRH